MGDSSEELQASNSTEYDLAVLVFYLTIITTTGIVATINDSDEGSDADSTNMKREQASVRVLSYLRALAMRGELKPGDRLPTERQLARELCISRASLREGIVHLTASGVLKSVHGVGTFVVVDPHYGPLEAFSEFYNFPACQMFETRLALEPSVAALAAKRATRKQIADLGEEVIDICRAEGVWEQHHIHDVRFRRMVALACGNPILSALIDAVTAGNDAKSRSREQFVDFAEETEMHRTIYRAIRSHDPGAARLAMEQHLQLSRTSLTIEAADVAAKFVPSVSDQREMLMGRAV
jgi:GntR family transcriptional repressor for pyruvate dehydrogenase complex